MSSTFVSASSFALAKGASILPTRARLVETETEPFDLRFKAVISITSELADELSWKCPLINESWACSEGMD